MEQVKIIKSEVLRYLGYKNSKIDNKIDDLIGECIYEIHRYADFRYVYKSFQIESSKEGIVVKGTNLILKGLSIKEHLRFSESCVLMAVTLGYEIERRINLYKKIDLTKAVVIDACATTAVEAMCDLVEKEIGKTDLMYNKKLTNRYSPGYGDLSINIQRPFLNILNSERKIGVTVSENNILFPRKSVTAIIGVVSKDTKLRKRSCKECSNYEKCEYRKEGYNCEC